VAGEWGVSTPRFLVYGLLKTPSAILGGTDGRGSNARTYTTIYAASVRAASCCSTISRVLYASDASSSEVEPAGIAVPRRRGRPLCAGTLCRRARCPPPSLAERGLDEPVKSLGTGVIVDLSLNFNNIEICDGGALAHVQPGVTLRQLNAVLEPYGWALCSRFRQRKSDYWRHVGHQRRRPARCTLRHDPRPRRELYGLFSDSGDTARCPGRRLTLARRAARVACKISFWSTATLLEQSAGLMAALSTACSPGSSMWLRDSRCSGKPEQLDLRDYSSAVKARSPCSPRQPFESARAACGGPLSCWRSPGLTLLSKRHG
jgi:hypothetical protein